MDITIPRFRSIVNDMNKEIPARSLISFENRYVVSEEGDVYIVRACKQGESINFVLGKLKTTISSKGYTHVRLYSSRYQRYTTERVDMLVAEAFDIPHPIGYHTLDHINGITTENQVSNLAWIE